MRLRIHWLACVLVLSVGQGSTLAAGPHLELKIGKFDPTSGRPPLSESLRLQAEPESGIFIVQLRRAIVPADLSRLRALGAQTLGFVPEQAYLVRLPAGAAAAIRALPEVRWVGAVEPGWKIAPDLGTRPYNDPSRREGGILQATADLYDGEDTVAAAARVREAGAEVLQILEFAGYARLKVRGTRAQLEAAARVPAVSWIEEAAEIETRNNTTRWVIQTNVTNSTTVWDHGIHGEGQIVGHIDGRIDMNSCYFQDPANNTPGPSHRKVVGYHSASGLGADSHGTHTAGTSAGDQAPVTGQTNQNGNAWAAKISHSNLNDIDGSGTSPSNLYNYLVLQHGEGARVHTNSWGDDGTRAYTTWSVDIDRFSYDHEDDLVFFAVSNGSIVTTPENAKNCVGIGATQNGANDGNHCSGGRGPTLDGRRKPELYTPGCSIVSARSNIACSTNSSTGTSMASPSATAAGALVRQYYVEGWYPSGTKTEADAIAPTGALVKATLLNSAVDMTGVAGFPSDIEGWGRVLLENALHFSGDVRKLSMLDDVRNASGLTTGGVQTYPVPVEASGEPLKVTLVWTEPPAVLLASQAAVNNLDLEVVSPTGTTYLGNVFNPATGQSLEGGTADLVNNVEQVLVPSPEAGTWTVRVLGTAVNQGTQGYAVVASGQVTPASGGPLKFAGTTILDTPPLGNGDGVVDPGETVTMPLSLRNASSSAISSITAALRGDQATLVKVTTASAGFPDAAPSGTVSSQSPHYRFTVEPGAACGASVGFALETASSVGTGQASFGLPVGKTRQDFPAAGMPLTIPKKSSAGVSSPVSVAQPLTIKDLTVFVNIVHADVGEIVVTLTSPAGTVVTLHNRTRPGTANIVATYDTDRPPDGPGTMNAFNGQNAAGTWTLRVVDSQGGPTGAGQIVAWTLDVEATSPISCSPLSCATPVPEEVAPSVALAAENGLDLRLDWPAVSGASAYRVWRSQTPDFANPSLVGATSDTTVLLGGELAAGAPGYYEVRAVNSCEWEGP